MQDTKEIQSHRMYQERNSVNTECPFIPQYEEVGGGEAKEYFNMIQRQVEQLLASILEISSHYLLSIVFDVWGRNIQ